MARWPARDELTVAALRVADRVEVRELTAPIRFGGGELTLAPLRGQLADGTLGGQVTVRLAGPTRYAVTLDLRDARAEALLAALGGRSLGGRLQAQASFTGAAEGATGQGHAEIRDGQLHDFPVLGAVATALNLPLLRDLRFQEGAIDFVLAGDVLRTPVVRFVSGDVRILGKGEILLRTGELAHEFTLLVPPAAVRRAPREMRAAFTERPDGLMGVDFRVWGPYRSPRTDLQDRVLRGLRGVAPAEGAPAVPALAGARAARSARRASRRAGCPGSTRSAIVASTMARGRVFYGWWVTIAFAVMVFLSTGVRFSVGPFLKPIVADLGTDRATYSLVVSLSLLLYGVFMPFVGRLVERWGARPVAVLGTLVFAASLAGTGLVTQLWQLTLVYGVLVALGLSATGHVVGSAVVSRWFTRRRATALSLLGAASMAGMSLLVPVAMWLILTVGWRATYAIIGLRRRPSSSCPSPCGSSGSRRSRWGSRPTVWPRTSRRRADAAGPGAHGREATPSGRRPSGSSAAACSPAGSR